MHVKCPKCGAVFEWAWQPTLVHAGSSKYLKCPACGKHSFMRTGVDDPITWPEAESGKGST
jgi:ribosomal protein S27E